MQITSFFLTIGSLFQRPVKSKNFPFSYIFADKHIISNKNPVK